MQIQYHGRSVYFQHPLENNDFSPQSNAFQANFSSNQWEYVAIADSKKILSIKNVNRLCITK